MNLEMMSVPDSAFLFAELMVTSMLLIPRTSSDLSKLGGNTCPLRMNYQSLIYCSFIEPGRGLSQL